MDTSFDVIVIGAGPAGYVAAIRASQLGLKTACIDEFRRDGQPALGGTCLNVGCIPSKALLESSHHFYALNHEFSEHGISASDARIDVKKMQARKEKVVGDLTSGIQQLFKGNGVTAFHGHGRLLSSRRVSVLDPETDDIAHTLSARNVILATGSTPIELPGMAFDHEKILNSDDLLALDKIPKSLAIVGAGVIGLELGSVWRRLGAEVTLLEALDEFLPAADKNIARVAAAEFKKQGLNIELGAKVQAIKTTKTACTLSYEHKGEAKTLKAEKVAVMVGRKPNVDNLLAADSGVETDERGFIKVDEQCRTDIDGVWAIGDVVRGPMLAHKGSEEGVMVAELIAGQKPEPMDYSQVPSVIYTEPEVAWVGLTEVEAKNRVGELKVGSFPFAAVGRARASGHTQGLVKIIADADTDAVLGVHMVGAGVSELIAEAGFAMAYQSSAEDIGRAIHAHPTLAEAVKEAALSVHKEAIHKVN